MRFVVLTALALSLFPALAAPSFKTASRALQTLWPDSTREQRARWATSVGGEPMSKESASDSVIVENAVAAAKILRRATGRSAERAEVREFLEHLAKGLNQTDLVVPTRDERVAASRLITSWLGLTVSLAVLGNSLHWLATMQWGSVPMDVAASNFATSQRNLLFALVPFGVLGAHFAHGAFLKSRPDARFVFPGSESVARSRKSRRARFLFFESFAAELENDSNLEIPRDPKLLFAIAQRVWSPGDIEASCAPLLEAPAG